MLYIGRILYGIIISLIIVIFITGCSSKNKQCLPTYVVKKEVKFISIPKSMYKDDIEVPKPPDKELYISSKPEERERLLTNLIIELYKTIRAYRLKLFYIEKTIENNQTISNRKEKEK